MNRAGRTNGIGNGNICWRHVLSVRGIVIVCITFASLFSVLSTPAVAQARAIAPHLSRASSPQRMAPAGKPSQRASQPPRSLLQDEANWFQLSHFGSKLPTYGDMIRAYKQAHAHKPYLPVPPLAGGGSWAQLGPQPLNSNTNSCGTGDTCQDGPVSGRITAIAVNPGNAQDVWAGAADGGVWHSTDGGNSWAPVFDNQYTLAIGSIAVVPNATNPANGVPTVYVGTGEANQNLDAYWGAGIFKSTDGGQTWIQPDGQAQDFSNFEGLTIGKIVVDPANSQTILAAVSNPFANAYNNTPPPKGAPETHVGIWLSTNGGTSWSQVLSLFQIITVGATDVVFDPTNPSIVFAGLAEDPDAGVWESQNTGAAGSWTLVSALPNGGNASIGRVSLGMSQDGTTVYTVMASPQGSLLNCAVYVSTNTGQNWTTISNSYTQAMCGDSSFHQWWYELALAVAPNSSGPHPDEEVYLGGVDLWYSPDGGNTWYNQTNAYGTNPSGVHGDQHTIVFTSSSTFLLGNDGGIWQGTLDSINPATSFVNLNAHGPAVTQFYSGSVGLNDNGNSQNAQLYGGAQDNGEDQYNGVAEWNEVVGNDAGDTIVNPQNNSYVYEESTYGAIKKSIDAGNTWNPATMGLNACKTNCDPTNFVMPYVMWQNSTQMPGNEIMLAGTDKVYETTNGGGQWTAISLVLDNSSPACGTGPSAPCPISALAVAPASNKYITQGNSPQYIYAGDNSGKIYATANGGGKWSQIFLPPVPAMVTGLAVDPTNPSVVYATYADFADSCATGQTNCQHLYKYNGSTWTDLSVSTSATPQLPNAPFESVLVDPNNDTHIVVGTDVGVFISTDSGATWSPLGTGLPNVAIDQIFTDSTGQNLYVATHGRGMWATVFDPNVYANTGGGTSNLVSLTEKGALRWTYSGSSGQHYPTYDNSTVFITDYNSSGAASLFALSAKTGAILWQTSAAFGIPAAANGTVYASGADGSGQAEMVALNEATGAVLWTYDTQDRAYLTGPTIANGAVYVGSTDGIVYALSTSSGALLWKSVQLCYPCSQGIQYAPAVDSGQVYVVNYDADSLIELNATTGQEGWYDLGTEPPYVSTFSPPTAANGQVYFAGSTQTSRNALIAVSAQTGDVNWAYATGTSQLATSAAPWVAGGVVYNGASDQSIYAVSAATGAKLWSYATGGVTGSPIVADGILYDGSGDNYLYAISVSSGTLLWKYNMGTDSYPTARPAVGA